MVRVRFGVVGLATGLVVVVALAAFDVVGAVGPAAADTVAAGLAAGSALVVDTTTCSVDVTAAATAEGNAAVGAATIAAVSGATCGSVGAALVPVSSEFDVAGTGVADPPAEA